MMAQDTSRNTSPRVWNLRGPARSIWAQGKVTERLAQLREEGGRLAGPYRSWYHQQRLRVSVFSRQGVRVYVVSYYTTDVDLGP